MSKGLGAALLNAGVKHNTNSFGLGKLSLAAMGDDDGPVLSQKDRIIKNVNRTSPRGAGLGVDTDIGHGISLDAGSNMSNGRTILRPGTDIRDKPVGHTQGHTGRGGRIVGSYGGGRTVVKKQGHSGIDGRIKGTYSGSNVSGSAGIGTNKGTGQKASYSADVDVNAKLSDSVKIGANAVHHAGGTEVGGKASYAKDKFAVVGELKRNAMGQNSYRAEARYSPNKNTFFSGTVAPGKIGKPYFGFNASHTF